MQKGVIRPPQPRSVPLDEKLLPEAMKQCGYHTEVSFQRISLVCEIWTTRPFSGNHLTRGDPTITRGIFTRPFQNFIALW